MSNMDAFCRLVGDESTEPQEITQFIYDYHIDINAPNSRGVYPIQVALLQGNETTIELFLRTLKPELDRGSLNLLDLAAENKHAKSYLFNPKNRAWELADGPNELLFHACAGNRTAIVGCLGINIHDLFVKYDNNYPLDWAHRFSQLETCAWLEKHILDIIPYYDSREDYGIVANLYNVLTHYYVNTVCEMQKGLEYGILVKIYLEKAIDRYPQREEFQSQLSITLLNLAMIKYNLGTPDSFEFETIIHLLNRAKEIFSGTSCQNIREYNTKLATILLHRRNALEKNLKANISNLPNFNTYKLTSETMSELDDQIEKLYQQIPDNMRTESDDKSLDACIDRRIQNFEHLTSTEKTFEYSKNSSEGKVSLKQAERQREEKRKGMFDSLFAKEKKQAIYALEQFDIALQNCQWDLAKKFLTTRMNIVKQIEDTYKEKEELHCNSLTQALEQAKEENLTHLNFLASIMPPPYEEIASSKNNSSALAKLPLKRSEAKPEEDKETKDEYDDIYEQPLSLHSQAYLAENTSSKRKHYDEPKTFASSAPLEYKPTIFGTSVPIHNNSCNINDITSPKPT